MNNYIDRVIQEREDLIVKITKLDTFLQTKSESLSSEEGLLLRHQLHIMQMYADTLTARLELI